MCYAICALRKIKSTNYLGRFFMFCVQNSLSMLSKHIDT